MPGMQVPYEVRPAPEHGGAGAKGLFATAPIAAGTLVWDIRQATIEVHPAAEAEALCTRLEAAGELDGVLQHDYFCATTCEVANAGDMIDLQQDDGRFFNHDSSAARNVGNGGSCAAAAEAAAKACDEVHPECTYATRDIAAGEQLLDDYNDFGDEPPWFEALLKKHNVPTDYYMASS